MKSGNGNSQRLFRLFSGKTLLAFLAIMFTSTLLFGDWDGSATDVYTMGRVGIGTDNPMYNLEVSSSSANSNVGITAVGDYFPYLYLTRTNGITKANRKYYICVDTPGNLTFVDRGEDGSESNVRLSILKDGNMRFNGIIFAQAYTCLSDLRYKHNIEPIQNSLQKIMALNGVMYNWKTAQFKDKGFSKDRQIGLVAQDVEKVLPELVMTDDEGYKSVQYSKVTAVLVEAMKEMNMKTVALEKENASLKQRIASLEKMSERIAELEKAVEKGKSLAVR